jgi:tyrosine-protein kinase Etk/Wzc
MANNLAPPTEATGENLEEDGPPVSLVDLFTWLGRGKYLIVGVTAATVAASLAISLTLTPIFTARTSLLSPGVQQQSGSAAVLASLGSLGGVAGGLGVKTPEELYVTLLKSDGIARALDERFALKARYNLSSNEALRKALPLYIRVWADKKTGVINIEVDDKDPKFAADLANAHADAVSQVLGRLAVSEAQQRRAFFDRELKATKENLIKAELNMRRMQENSGLVMLDKQAEALIAGAGRVRVRIAEREVQLQVMRTNATDENPDVIRLKAEILALRSELVRVESNQPGNPGSAVGIPVGKIPEVAVDYARARRELALQETLLDAMTRQFELAKLDEAKEGPLLQQIDKAVPPDWKSKPSRAGIVLVSTLLALLGSTAWVVARHAMARERNSTRGAAWRVMKKAWRFRA